MNKKTATVVVVTAIIVLIFASKIRSLPVISKLPSA